MSGNFTCYCRPLPLCSALGWAVSSMALYPNPTSVYLDFYFIFTQKAIAQRKECKLNSREHAPRAQRPRFNLQHLQHTGSQVENVIRKNKMDR